MNPHSAQPSFAGAPARHSVPDMGFADFNKGQTYQRSRTPYRLVFMGTGILLLGMLCIVPIWNALALMEDANYVFWEGRRTPIYMVALCVGIALTYILAIQLFFSGPRQDQDLTPIMMMATLFITLLGLALILVSLPLSRQAVETYNNLMHRCDYSEQTRRMYEYSQVLQNIRAQPDCARKYSVEECEGYEDAPPYTAFLKAMENDFRCSGFCYSPGAAAALVQETSTDKATRAAAVAVAAKSGSNTTAHASAAADSRRHRHTVTPLALLSTDETVAEKTGAAAGGRSRYPPTLFSDANYQASCEGMAARDIKNFAGDVGFQTFYQGIYLVFIAIATGFLKLMGFCVQKDV